ncbi:hypothetical protein [Siphonobacter sp. BAB-5385]|uniref:hypothetical protein n=1 Tax=Siphonobacter sp. BAB-5385 TaxID=1864822 RepID=UPI00113FC948|nr:hypothetical protein [Siphonobacter sp. BAB-5385]
MKLLEIRPNIQGSGQPFITDLASLYISIMAHRIGIKFVQELSNVDFGRSKQMLLYINLGSEPVDKHNAAREPSLRYNIRLGQTTGWISIRESDLRDDLLLRPLTYTISKALGLYLEKFQGDLEGLRLATIRVLNWDYYLLGWDSKDLKVPRKHKAKNIRIEVKEVYAYRLHRVVWEEEQVTTYLDFPDLPIKVKLTSQEASELDYAERLFAENPYLKPLPWLNDHQLPFTYGKRLFHFDLLKRTLTEINQI